MRTRNMKVRELVISDVLEKNLTITLKVVLDKQYHISFNRKEILIDDK